MKKSSYLERAKKFAALLEKELSHLGYDYDDNISLCNLVFREAIRNINHKKSWKALPITDGSTRNVEAAISIPINYFISYPVYSKLIPIEAIIGMYQQIRPNVNGLLECLVLFNAPFTLVKGLLCTALCFLIYKPLSPLLHR